MNLLFLLLLIVQIAFVIFLGVACEYHPAGFETYPLWVDIHFMIFAGFGLLMCFMKRHGWSSLTKTFLIAVLSIQVSIITIGCFEVLIFKHHFPIKVNLNSAILGDFAAAASLISFGALLGRVNNLQCVILVILEMIFYTLNEQIGLKYIEYTDIGGSMVVHLFGAYFGLAASAVIGGDAEKVAEPVSNYNSNLFSLIGTIMLWVYWPSFCAVFADDKELVVLNTLFALCGGVMGTFLINQTLGKRLNIVHIQNATLAGGVAIGAAADLITNFAGSLSVGLVAGAVCSVGYSKLKPVLDNYAIDVCGIHNLHGMPAVIGVASSIFAIMGQDIEDKGDKILCQVKMMFMTWAFALVGGAITGSIMSVAPAEKVDDKDEFDMKFDTDISSTSELSEKSIEEPKNFQPRSFSSAMKKKQKPTEQQTPKFDFELLYD